MNDKIQDLAQREVSRADFLRYTGVALLGVIGISSFLKSLHRNVPGNRQSLRSGGYGGSAYGR